MAEAFSSLSTSIKFTEIEDVLVKYATRIALDAEKNLRSNKNNKDSNASGSLSESITITPVEFFGSNYSIEIKMLDYWEWVNDGRPPGGRPPVSKIIQWIKDKQLRLDDKGTTARGYKRDGTLISKSKKKVLLGKNKVSILNAIAYKIAARIGKNGTKGTDFLTDAIENHVEDLINEMKQAGKRNIVIEIKSFKSDK
jgi:hypothetical protein